MARNFPSQSRSLRVEAAEYPLNGCSVSGVAARSRRQETTSRDSRAPARMHFLRGVASHRNEHFFGLSIIEPAAISARQTRPRDAQHERDARAYIERPRGAWQITNRRSRLFNL